MCAGGRGARVDKHSAEGSQRFRNESTLEREKSCISDPEPDLKNGEPLDKASQPRRQSAFEVASSETFSATPVFLGRHWPL